MNCYSELKTKIEINKQQECTNCGSDSHTYKMCPLPITSYGIIAVKYDMCDLEKRLNTFENMHVDNFDNIKFLLIQRKDTLSFVEFIRGKYNPYDDSYIVKLLKNMTQKEHEKLLTHTFEELWISVWGETSHLRSHKNDYDNSLKKHGLIYEKLVTLIQENPTKHKEAEWGFPKGRRNPHESDIVCAIREFQEETSIRRSDFSIVSNIQPISETFFGSNFVHYCHKYYIAICDSSVDVAMNMCNHHMLREIGSIRWCNLDEAMALIRPDNVEKREILFKAGKIMKNFCPISQNDEHRKNYESCNLYNYSSNNMSKIFNFKLQ